MSERNRSQAVDRRTFVILATGAAAGAVMARPGTARAATSEEVEKAVRKAIGDKNAKSGKGVVELEVPQIAENGNTVPIGVRVDSPMTAEDHVTAVHIFALGNPSPDVVSFRFTPQSGRAEAATRMRLAKTQNVVAIAETSKGEAYRTEAEIKVTIGGCGG